MGTTAALAMIPWRRIFRYFPGALGIPGEIMRHGGEKTRSVMLRLLEAQQKCLAGTMGHLASRLNVMFWAAVAVLVVAFGALAAALLE